MNRAGMAWAVLFHPEAIRGLAFQSSGDIGGGRAEAVAASALGLRSGPTRS